jgi:hypothetical protein
MKMVLAGAPALGLGIASALVCYLVAGGRLGMFFGGIVAATLLTPPLVMGEERWLERLVVWAALVAGIALVWLAGVFSGQVTAGAWAANVLVLASYSWAIAAIAVILHRLRIGAVPAAAVAVVMGLIWLSWPMWLCPWLTSGNREAVVGYLVAPHPLMAINGAMRETYGVYWPHHTIAYRLANTLNDVSYGLPKSVAASVVFHVQVGGVLLLLSMWKSGHGRAAHATE